MKNAPLALTMGDPAGIGPELILRAWSQRAEGIPPFFALAAPEPLMRLARQIGIAAPIAIVPPEEAAEVFSERLPVVALEHEADAQPGEPDPRFARATLESIERAVALTQQGRAAAVVTNPIAKKTLYDAGFRHPGHTEYLGELARASGADADPVMMIWSPLLAVVPVTILISLADAARAVTREAIESTARIVARDMRERFRIENPRIAVAGLNPHAGEGGAMGREEIEIIAPAIAALRAEGLDIFGPLPADDVALTMYHDQGLIPAKTLAFDDGVNVTLGLPFVRTSPDHGTAFDIAGHGTADPSSLVAALNLAARLAA